MKRYRKKPVVVDAIQLSIEDFTDEHPNDRHVPGVIYDTPHREARIETLEGTMTAKLGDWIIKGLKDELYPCKPDIFEATYDCVDDYAVADYPDYPEGIYEQA